MTHSRTLAASLAAATFASLMSAGCSTRSDDSVGHRLLDRESQPRLVEAAMLAQAGNGASADRMLVDAHFDGPTLNSLGEQKLSLMLEDPAWHATPAVYVVAEEPGRVASIERFYESIGLDATSVDIRSGFNPEATLPSALVLRREAQVNAAQTGLGSTDQ